MYDVSKLAYSFVREAGFDAFYEDSDEEEYAVFVYGTYDDENENYEKTYDLNIFEIVGDNPNVFEYTENVFGSETMGVKYFIELLEKNGVHYKKID